MSALKHAETALPEMAHAVAEGLSRRSKALPPYLFYDTEGSRLIRRNHGSPRVLSDAYGAHAILEKYARDILERAGSNLSLIELGAGTAAKTSILIRALVRRQLQVKFYPIDVCAAALEIARQNLTAISSRVQVHPIVADYTCGFDGIARLEGRKLALYLGSSIGNFELREAGAVLWQLRSQLQPNDALLLGTDLAKSPAVLLPAYDDEAGVTARFNQNLLTRINRELDADFDLRCFRHLAQWNPAHSRIEIIWKAPGRRRSLLAGWAFRCPLRQANVSTPKTVTNTPLPWSGDCLTITASRWNTRGQTNAIGSRYTWPERFETSSQFSVLSSRSRGLTEN